MNLLGSHLALLLVALCRAFDDEDDYDDYQFDDDFLGNTDHLKEHMEDWADIDFSKSTPEELAFYFFELHDTDENRMLDGLEMYTAMRHSLEHIKVDSDNSSEKEKRYTSAADGFIRSIDLILKDSDINDDGYIDYLEFSKSRTASKAILTASTHLY